MSGIHRLRFLHMTHSTHTTVTICIRLHMIHTHHLVVTWAEVILADVASTVVDVVRVAVTVAAVQPVIKNTILSAHEKDLIRRPDFFLKFSNILSDKIL